MPVRDVLKTVSDRLRSPYLGSFLVSFAFLNWKIFLWFFSGDIYTERKIQMIENYIESPEFGKSFSTSIGIMLIYVMLVPFFISLLSMIKTTLEVVSIKAELWSDKKKRSTRDIAGSYEEISTSLKQSLIECRKDYEKLNNSIETLIEKVHMPLQENFKELVKLNKTKIEHRLKDLSHVEDILTANITNYQQVLQRYYEIRQKRK